MPSSRAPRSIWLALALTLGLAACGRVVDPPAREPREGGVDDSGPDDAAAGDETSGRPDAAIGFDPGRVGIHRLNNTEYDNTVTELFGFPSSAAKGFLADERAAGFDNIADALEISPERYSQY